MCSFQRLMTGRFREAAVALSERAKETLAACAEASLPAGARLPAGGVRTATVLDQALDHLPRAVALAVTALARVADGLALRQGRRSIAALPVARRFALLEAWRTAPVYPVRQGFRALASALKAAHFGDPEISRRSGCRLPADRIDEPPARWRSQAIDLGAPGPDEEHEADVVVVGSGAGGAAAARVLAEGGLAVVVVEQGPLFSRRDFTGSVLARLGRMYSAQGLQATVGNVSILLPTGRAVGGTTLVNAGTCMRTPPWILRRWRDELGVPLGEAELDRWFERVEGWLEVGVPGPRELGVPAQVIARGAESLGIAHGPLRRNAPGCDAQGLCCFGCPTGAKRSADVALVPAALEAGGLLFSNAAVSRIDRSPGAAVVRASSASGRRLTVRARVAIVAAGSLATPLLLERIGVRHPALGKNLSIHPVAAAIGLFPFDVAMDEAIPQGYGLEGMKEEGLLFEAGATPFDMTAVGTSLHGPRLVELMERHRRLLTFGFNVRDRSRGRVVRGPGGGAQAIYFLGEADVEQMAKGMRILIDLFVGSGAERVMPPVAFADEVAAAVGSRALDGRTLKATDLDLSAYHPLGTARMGADGATSVVDMDLRVRGAPALMVCDGSVVPSSMGANPQVTIMALAARAAHRLGERLGR